MECAYAIKYYNGLTVIYTYSCLFFNPNILFNFLSLSFFCFVSGTSHTICGLSGLLCLLLLWQPAFPCDPWLCPPGLLSCSAPGWTEVPPWCRGGQGPSHGHGMVQVGLARFLWNLRNIKCSLLFHNIWCHVNCYCFAGRLQIRVTPTHHTMWLLGTCRVFETDLLQKGYGRHTSERGRGLTHAVFCT